MLNIGVIIPALNPNEKLIKLIKELHQDEGLKTIVIVNDGSDSQHMDIFKQITNLSINNLIILKHQKNRGMGAALKTGFKYLQAHFTSLDGVATMDSDGQHIVSALNSCITKFNSNPSNLIIGVRHFTNEIPFRIQFGNIMTSRLVKLVTHQNISDTQTGLRIIPINYMIDLITFPGDRFEFEFDMLLQAKKYDIQVLEQPIPTIYIDGNSSSHFRVIRDSIAIYSRFLKFAASGLASFIVDIALFYIVLFIIGNHILNSILIATVVSRILSSIVNYTINHHLVFNHAGQKTLIKYGCLFVVQMFASGILTNALTVVFPSTNSQLMPTLAKMIVDFILFIISYQIQRDFIFKEVPRHA